MVSTDTITRNSDGTYTSSYGYQISQAPNGDLYSGGAPTGYRDIGFGVQLSPYSSWSDPTDYSPFKPRPSPSPAYASPMGYSGPYVPAPAGPPLPWWHLFGWPIYPWMLLVGLFAYFCLSGSTKLLPGGLHLHPAWGVAAFVTAIALYRLFMAFLPTALTLAGASALFVGATAWSLTDQRSFARFVGVVSAKTGNLAHGWPVADIWSTFVSQIAPVVNRWTVIAAAVTFLVHAAYWGALRSDSQQRRRSAKTSAP